MLGHVVACSRWKTPPSQTEILSLIAMLSEAMERDDEMRDDGGRDVDGDGRCNMEVDVDVGG